MENVSLNFGPLESFLRDESITEIMVNRFDTIFFEREGRLVDSSLRFASEGTLQALIQSIATANGREINLAHPFMDGYLADGSRVNASLPPMSPKGATLTIRKFRKNPYQLEDYVKLGSISDKAAYFLHACVIARINVVVSGGTGTGKTTFLNALCGLVPQNQRIVTIEDVAELNLQHPNWVRLESVLVPGKVSVSTKDCLVNSLRMRPDRIVVGECRRDETFEMLQAMNTGHDGSMTTVHANSPRDCLIRLESLILTAQIEIPLAALRRQISSALQIIVQLKRMKNGQRVVSEIVEVTGMEQANITSQTLFTREKKKPAQPNALAPEGDTLAAAGLVPSCMHRFSEGGVQFPQSFFDPNTKVTYQPD